MKKFTFAILSLLAGTVLTAAQSELQKEINTQISAGKKVIKLTRPEYRSAKTIELRKLDGVTIDGNALKGKQTNVRSITMATMFVTIIPIIIVYPFLQRYFVKGITIGSVKG